MNAPSPLVIPGSASLINLALLRPGEKLHIETERSHYTIKVTGPSMGTVESNNASSAKGPARLWGAVSPETGELMEDIIRPGHQFMYELLVDQGFAIQTSRITRMNVIKAEDATIPLPIFRKTPVGPRIIIPKPAPTSLPLPIKTFAFHRSTPAADPASR